MKLKKLFLILTALVAFSSTLTAVSNYDYLLGKYKSLKERVDAEKEEKRRIAEEERLSAEKKAREKTEREAKKVRMMKTELTQKQC